MEQWIKTIQILLGTGLVGVFGAWINSDIQQREIAIKEMDQLGQYVELVTNEEVGRRLKFSEFFMSLTQSEEARKGWERYHSLVQQEYDKEEAKKKALALEKDKRDKELALLSKQAADDAKRIAQLKKRLETATSSQKSSIISEIDLKQAKATETATKLASKEESLATIQQQIVKSENKLSFIPQKIESTAVQIGWVFLGTYNGKSWDSTYFDIEDTTKPESLDGKKITVSAKALNVRSAKPNALGKMGTIEFTLSGGDRVKILEVDEWFSSGYIWARVELLDSLPVGS